MTASSTRPVILLGLNEVNFDFVRAYAAEGRLPNFKRLFAASPIIETTSESAYEELEPWIQWVSVQTGKTLADHGVFRLGDIKRTDHTQIWEHLESEYGVKVAAVSPMNGANRAKAPAFFVPDPWTDTEAEGDWFLKRLAAAVSDAVNANASSSNKLSTLATVGLGLLRYSARQPSIAAARQVKRAAGSHYQKALLLDHLLTDVFAHHYTKTMPGFSSLFLNSAAHIQHHYMFNCKHYTGPHSNPEWYMASNVDPLFDSYQCFDRLLGKVLSLPGNPRVLVATGLHQNPVENPIFYWRLNHHAAFLDQLGIRYASVHPRMSRDFLVEFSSESNTNEAEAVLRACTDQDGKFLFEEIENRGTSLFVSLTYPHDIPTDLVVRHPGGQISGLRDLVSFVALKNGDHNGIGYLVDTANELEEGVQIPVTEIFNLIDAHFARDLAAK